MRYGNPDYDITKLLEEFKVEGIEEKMKKAKIDKELFWQMNEGELGECFDIKKFGTKRRLHQKIEELKEEHKLKMEKKDKDSKKLSEEEKQNLSALAMCYCGENHEAQDHDDDDIPLLISKQLSIKPSLIRTKSRY